MIGKIKYEFKARVWQHSSPGGWYFVSLPTELSLEIRENLKWQEEGWGRLKVTAKIGIVEWETSIWFDKKQKTYLLPLKAEIRKREKIKTNQEVKTVIRI
jgi:hypothetical protein